MTSEEDILRCPHCKVRVRRPPPAPLDKIHTRKCKKCGKKYVVYDEVEHWMGTAEPAPVKLEDKFRLKPGTLGDPKTIFTVKGFHLTRTQGWWVYGVHGKGHCSVDVASIDLLPKGQKRGRNRRKPK